jgi:hypothetical protein
MADRTELDGTKERDGHPRHGDRDVGNWFVALDDPVRRHRDSHRLLAGPRCRPQRAQLFGYFIFSLIFFPAALIVAYMVRDRRAMV